MPNYVINEIIFKDLTEGQIEKILSSVKDKEGNLDFNILMLIPIRKAYDSKIVVTKGKIVLQFQTTYGPPTEWIRALIKAVKIPFTHFWMDEGSLGNIAYVETWKGGLMAPDRKEVTDNEIKFHLEKLLWGE